LVNLGARRIQSARRLGEKSLLKRSLRKRKTTLKRKKQASMGYPARQQAAIERCRRGKKVGRKIGRDVRVKGEGSILGLGKYSKVWKRGTRNDRLEPGEKI